MFDSYDRDGNPCNETTPSIWDNRRVARTKIGDTVVSTVHLVINHQYLKHQLPLIFETMVFGGEHDEELDRYATEEAALRGHLLAVDRIRAGLKPFSSPENDLIQFEFSEEE